MRYLCSLLGASADDLVTAETPAGCNFDWLNLHSPEILKYIFNFVLLRLTLCYLTCFHLLCLIIFLINMPSSQQPASNTFSPGRCRCLLPPSLSHIVLLLYSELSRYPFLISIVDIPFLRSWHGRTKAEKKLFPCSSTNVIDLVRIVISTGYLLWLAAKIKFGTSERIMVRCPGQFYIPDFIETGF